MASKKRTPRGGRPSLSGNGPTPRLQVRISTEDREVLDEAAASEGKTVSAWAREVLLRAARRVLGRK